MQSGERCNGGLAAILEVDDEIAMLKNRNAALFVDRSSQHWVVRDPKGNFWIVPSVENPWNHHQSFLDETKLRRVLAKMLDENEFLSPYGIRSLSRYHADRPYVFQAGGQEYRVDYLPAESDTGMFGGNSNWRGPIWMPVNGLIIRALLQYYTYYGNDFTVECPTRSGQQMNLYQVAEEIVRRAANIFLRDKDGRRPVYGGTRKFQENPHWRDYVLFYEYFHGANGAGLGANHQTGWTGIIARAMHLFVTSTPEEFLALGKMAAVMETEPRQKRGRARAAKKEVAV